MNINCLQQQAVIGTGNLQTAGTIEVDVRLLSQVSRKDI